MAPVDKSTDGSDSDVSGTAQSSVATDDKNGDKTNASGTSGQKPDKLAKQGTPVLDTDSSTTSSKLDDTQVLSE